MKTYQSLAAILGLATMASAHMEMTEPAPLRSKHNKFTTSADFDMVAPLNKDGSNFPCKGFHTGSDGSVGKSVVTWTAGQTAKFTIAGGATHAGGSCQASLSYDNGATWKVVHSYIGNCPLQSDWEFTVPQEAPSGEPLFAWTWFNNLGNREMYMNCAQVTIEGGSGSLDSRPDMFVTNVANQDCTAPGKDVDFPNPGKDVTNASSNTAPPTCQVGGGGGGNGSPGNDAPVEQPPVVENPVEAPVEAPVEVPDNGTPVAPTTTSAPAVPTTTKAPGLPGGIFITVTTTKAPIATETPTTPPVSETPPDVENPPVTTPDDGAVGALTGDCSTEGKWNCIGGVSFQRCASGSWSTVMQMAAGTSCSPGQSDNFSIRRRTVLRV